MEKKLSDYLYLYLGCDCIAGDGGRLKLISISEGGTCMFYVPPSGMVEGDELEFDISEVKPILRPLHDMTEQEACDMVNAHPFYGKHETMHWEYYRRAVHFKVIYTGQSRRWSKQIAERGETPEQFKYLLSKGFDLFNLIPEGLAVDATKLDINSLIINQ